MPYYTVFPHNRYKPSYKWHPIDNAGSPLSVKGTIRKHRANYLPLNKKWQDAWHNHRVLHQAVPQGHTP